MNRTANQSFNRTGLSPCRLIRCSVPLPRIPDMLIAEKALTEAKGKAAKYITLPDGTRVKITITVEEEKLKSLAEGESVSVFMFLDTRSGSDIEIGKVSKDGKSDNLKEKGWHFS